MDRFFLDWRVDWREACAEARRCGRFTPIQKLAAQNWITCAVGEQHRRNPNAVCYDRTAWPVDDTLYFLGGGGYVNYGFAYAVRHDDVEKAERLLDAIEDRVLELKREQI